MAGASPSFSSSAPSPKPYDVFISFRGEDTRRNFIAHLHPALSQKGIQTWKDNINLEKGAEVWPALVDAIDNSYLCIVVFSKNYASSTWCLRELTRIVECKKDKQIISVFYQINPSDIRKQTGSYEEAFQQHIKNPELDKEVQKWRDSLVKASNLCGFDSESNEYRDDYHLIENIVKDIRQKLEHIYPRSDPKGLVGLDKNCPKIESLLENFQRIGLWGMGGIGKTTIARVLFNRYSSQYNGRCFLDNVRENLGQQGRGLPSLRKTLFSELLNDSVDPESDFVKNRVSKMKVFIVLDDVDTFGQIEVLLQDINFKPDSRIIITTRDKQVLEGSVDKIHEIMGLDYEESFQLFYLKAFQGGHPQTIFEEEVSARAVSYVKGLPLGLKLLGSFLCSRRKETWDQELEKLKKYPYKPIDSVLRLSYDDLDYEEKQIFLDIAFFFKGERKEDVENFLNACKFFATIGLDTLQNKALITISDEGEVEMHDLIQEMGWQIVREQYIEDPQRCSRLRNHTEICNVLKSNKGIDAIEGISLEGDDLFYFQKDSHFSGNVLEKMTKLRFLRLSESKSVFRTFDGFKIIMDISDGARFCQIQCQYNEYQYYWLGEDVSISETMDLPYLFKKVNLEFIDFSNSQCLHHVPATFCIKNLVRFIMCDIPCKKLWDGVLELEHLEEIDLSGCEKLIEIPDLSKASKLQVVSLRDCTNLSQVHPSLLSLQSLYELNLSGCKNLKSLQCGTPLGNLFSLNLDRCDSLREFSLSSAKMQTLNLRWTTIETLHFGRCSNLQSLHLNYSRIKSLSSELSNLPSLIELNLTGCRELDTGSLHIILEGLCSLRNLYLQHSSVESLPLCMKYLSFLQYIDISNCERLRYIPVLPLSLKELNANDCTCLETVRTATSTSTPLDVGTAFLWNGHRMSFKNCVRLNANSNYAIQNDAHKRIMVAAASQCDHPIQLCFPGSQVPSWCRYHQMRSWITIELLPYAVPLGFAFSLVLYLGSSLDYVNVNPGLRVECKCHLEDSEIVTSKFQVYDWGYGRGWADHVILWYDEIHNEAIIKAIRESRAKHTPYNPKLSFHFFVWVTEYVHNQEEIDFKLDTAIKECGVWPIHASEIEYSAEEIEECLELGRDMDSPTKNLKPTFLTKGLELELGTKSYSTSGTGVAAFELKHLTETNFNCLLNNGELNIEENKVCSMDALESQNSIDEREFPLVVTQEQQPPRLQDFKESTFQPIQMPSELEINSESKTYLDNDEIEVGGSNQAIHDKQEPLLQMEELIFEPHKTPTGMPNDDNDLSESFSCVCFIGILWKHISRLIGFS